MMDIFFATGIKPNIYCTVVSSMKKEANRSKFLVIFIGYRFMEVSTRLKFVLGMLLYLIYTQRPVKFFAFHQFMSELLNVRMFYLQHWPFCICEHLSLVIGEV